MHNTQHDPRTCTNSVPCQDCDHVCTYHYEVSRDVFTEAQPENTTNAEIYEVTIYDEHNELIDSDTGYTSEALARQSGEDYLATHS